MTWKHGESGNPNGRPKVAVEWKDRCLAFMEADGWKELERLARAKRNRDHMRALELLAAYAVGKPTQRSELTGAGGGPLTVNIIERPKE